MKNNILVELKVKIFQGFITSKLTGEKYSAEGFGTIINDKNSLYEGEWVDRKITITFPKEMEGYEKAIIRELEFENYPVELIKKLVSPDIELDK